MAIRPEERLSVVLSGLDAAGWEVVGPELLPDHGGGRFVSRLIARREHLRLILCEADVRCSFPGYAERRDWRTELRAGAEDLMLVTDAAHGEFVLSAHLRAGHDRELYVEERVDFEPLELAALLEHMRRARPGTRVSPDSMVASKAEAMIEQALWNSLGECVTLPEREDHLIDWISSTATPPQVRRLWGALKQTVVLDPDCTSSDWLISAGEFLEACYLSTLARMRAFLIDASIRNSAERPDDPSVSGAERVMEADETRASGVVSFSKTLSGFCGETTKWVDRGLVRRSVVRRQLVGLARLREAADECRRALLAFGGDTRRLFPSLDANIRRLPSGVQSAKPAAEPGDHPRESMALRRADRRLSEDLKMFAGAWRLMVESRISDNWWTAEWAQATRELARLRRSLERRSVRGVAAERLRTFAGWDARLLIPALDPGYNLLVKAD